ncbi:hypothetical protein LEP1GSC034_1475 [Leptospira interrogans str. 2003000735]|uniref:Uncharacterized protein n=2 Tax=Leptospira interrogans TaxID=173 RepID=A0A829D8E0_LEPIR|nr:hypothetical protein LEP1GSC027_4800 [Leptospira interrogans str. 2002000624]EKQ36779.1 hypothetical protein LEP1GSC025_4742 [Leptospira interrogans str. 2002000621]EKQ48852.1 hypothetical protein LEP1GSC026_0335 [Leptospira interrogans str. 2002000623]EMJ69264.1 hypothetical protein LEP1GSC034_1475 [Leptospira interrogans str. 2003000735]EMJ71899.1 hypothetical protein LEP1GSC033_4069 [Leptospira interrogans str. 2002000632]EMJ78899.1 hypothetical protein LEP1GSC032_2274 [Leptospira interr
MMVAKLQKFDWTMILFIYPNSSNNFQNLTVNPRSVRVPTSIFYEKIA